LFNVTTCGVATMEKARLCRAPSVSVRDVILKIHLSCSPSTKYLQILQHVIGQFWQLLCDILLHSPPKPRCSLRSEQNLDDDDVLSDPAFLFVFRTSHSGACACEPSASPGSLEVCSISIDSKEASQPVIRYGGVQILFQSKHQSASRYNPFTLRLNAEKSPNDVADYLYWIRSPGSHSLPATRCLLGVVQLVIR